MSALPQYLGIANTVGVTVPTFHKLCNVTGHNPRCPECGRENALLWSGPLVYTCRDCHVVVVVVGPEPEDAEGAR